MTSELTTDLTFDQNTSGNEGRGSLPKFNHLYPILFFTQFIRFCGAGHIDQVHAGTTFRGHGKYHERHAPLIDSVGSEAIPVQPGTTMCYVPTFAEFAIANQISSYDGRTYYLLH